MDDHTKLLLMENSTVQQFCLANIIISWIQTVIDNKWLEGLSAITEGKHLIQHLVLH